jgi:hypothetical protein
LTSALEKAHASSNNAEDASESVSFVGRINPFALLFVLEQQNPTLQPTPSTSTSFQALFFLSLIQDPFPISRVSPSHRCKTGQPSQFCCSFSLSQSRDSSGLPAETDFMIC